ncbi:MAG: hypothetical protein WC221_08030 [Candidatus Riflebacteria bacterium]
MKKMFVLFLIVALLPFTTGCGIFGDNDDAAGLAAMGGAVDFTVNSELAGTISGNLRGSSLATYTKAEIEAMTITVGDVVLSFSELLSPSPINIKFAAKVSTTKLQELVEKNEPVAMTIKNSKGEEVKKFEIVLPQEIVTAGDEAAPEITVTDSGEITIKTTPTSTAKTVASFETTGGRTATQLSAPTIKWQEGWAGTPVDFKNGMPIDFSQPVFLITLKNGSSAVNLTNHSCDFSLKVTKANSETIAEYSKKVAAGDSFDEPNQKFALMVSDATNGVLLAELQSDLTPGTYTVNIPLITFTAPDNNALQLKGLKYSFEIQ